MNGSRERQAVDSISQQRDIKIVEKFFPSQAIEIVKIHNPQSEFFPKDFQIEIKNISQKPIYFVNFVGRLPNTIPLYDGIGLGFNLRYGNTRLITNGTLATPDDVPILPGKIGMMTIKSKEAAGLYETLVKTGKFSMLTEKITIVPQFINFGDGSGYLFEKFYGGEKNRSA